LKVEELEKKVAELEEKLKVTADIEEIKNLQYRYINYLSTHKWDEIMDCFTEDAVMDLKVVSKEGKTFGAFIQGKAEIAKEFKEGISKAHTGREGLFVVQPIISVDGNTATGKWLSYFMNIRSGGMDPVLHWMQGVYDCKYVKENGKWKFSLFKWRPRLRYKSSYMEYLECDLL
jgi:ketosteroid isomerase-like protein